MQRQIKRQLIYHLIKAHKNVDKIIRPNVDNFSFSFKGSRFFFAYTQTNYLNYKLCLSRIQRVYFPQLIQCMQKSGHNY